MPTGGNQTQRIDPTVEKEKSAEKNGNGEQEAEGEGQMYAPMQKGPVDPVESTGQGGQQQQSEQSSGFSGVRKMLHPAEALDSARHTAEVIMKDAMDALIRTKQRLMEILPSRIPAQAADAAKVADSVERDVLGKAEGVVPHPGTNETDSSDEKASERGLASSQSGGKIATNATVGTVHHSSSPDIQSIRKKLVVAKL